MADKMGYAWLLFWVTLIYLVNLMAVKMFNYPVVYCAGEAVISPLVRPFIEFLKVLTILVFIFRVAQRDVFGAAGAFAAVIFAFGLYDYAEIIFRLGAECGTVTQPKPITFRV